MSYYISKTVGYGFDEAIEKITATLKTEGFGVLTEIDVKTTLKNKLDADFRPYKILGACNPPFALKALTAEEQIGLLLPCNVVVQEKEPGHVVISAINPEEAMAFVNNSELAGLASEVKQKLERVIELV